MHFFPKEIKKGGGGIDTDSSYTSVSSSQITVYLSREADIFYEVNIFVRQPAIPQFILPSSLSVPISLFLSLLPELTYPSTTQ